jgi:hypothetical protein
MIRIIAIFSISFLFMRCNNSNARLHHSLEDLKKLKMELISNKQWYYTELYYNSTGNNKGTRVYKRGAANNLENRDNTRSFFWSNGTFDEVNGVSTDHTEMVWQFADEACNTYQISWGSGITTAEIIVLDENTFEWYNAEQKMYGIMSSNPIGTLNDKLRTP